MERRCRCASSGAERAGIRFDHAVVVFPSTGTPTKPSRLTFCSAPQPPLMPRRKPVQRGTISDGGGGALQ